MARRKIVFVIVEGASDDTALGVALNQVFDKDMVYIHIVHGDITTKAGVTPLNIVSRIGDMIRGYARAWHYKPSDFKQILHIVDTDGVYIPDTNVIVEENAGEVVYESDGIHTSNADGIIARNNAKRENLYRLRANGVIWGVPYRVYYMSCNLDHVLYDKRNSTDDEKERNAYSFAKRYKGDREGFVEFICNSDFSVGGDFKESWKHIETGLNSLERYTNLCLCISEEILAHGVQGE
ncbi:MAG: hypothetical protein K1W30_11910 [Lachnospiraceae bacterium]